MKPSIFRNVAKENYELRQPVKGARRLFYNENLFLGKEYYNHVLAGEIEVDSMRFYSRAYNTELADRIAEMHRVDAEEVFVGAGADEVIGLLAQVAGSCGRRSVVVEPTFGMYRVKILGSNGTPLTVLLRPDFTLDVDSVRDVLENCSLIFLCSPNNPTGNQYSRDRVLEMVEGFSGLLVVDEVYVDYAKYSLIKDLHEYENLVLLRSFSKTWGLAGLRLGYSISGSEIVKALRGAASPYNVSSVSKIFVSRAMERREDVQRAVESLKEMRDYMYDRLQRIGGVHVFPSDANFLLMRSRIPGLADSLLERMFQVRDVSEKPMCENCVRVTVPPKRIADQFLSALEALSVNRT